MTRKNLEGRESRRSPGTGLRDRLAKGSVLRTAAPSPPRTAFINQCENCGAFPAARLPRCPLCGYTPEKPA